MLPRFFLLLIVFECTQEEEVLLGEVVWLSKGGIQDIFHIFLFYVTLCLYLMAKISKSCAKTCQGISFLNQTRN